MGSGVSSSMALALAGFCFSVIFIVFVCSRLACALLRGCRRLARARRAPPLPHFAAAPHNYASFAAGGSTPPPSLPSPPAPSPSPPVPVPAAPAPPTPTPIPKIMQSTSLFLGVEKGQNLNVFQMNPALQRLKPTNQAYVFA